MICTDLFSGYRIHDRLHACIYISYAVDNLQFRDVHTHVWVGNALCTGMHSDGNVSGAVEHLGLDLQKRRARGRRARGRQPGVGTHSVADRPGVGPGSGLTRAPRGPGTTFTMGPRGCPTPPLTGASVMST